MKWTNDPHTMIIFDKWIRAQNSNLGDFVQVMVPHLPRTDTSMLFVTFAKFCKMYDDHRSRNPDEDLSLSFHRTLNTLMTEDSVKQMFARFAGKAAESNFKV